MESILKFFQGYAKGSTYKTYKKHYVGLVGSHIREYQIF
jgi:hypothetical protein